MSLNQRFLRCRITNDNFSTLKKKSKCRTCDREVSKIRHDGRRIFGQNVVVYEKGKARRATQVLGLVHSYLISPLPTPSYGGLRYVLTFIDYFSRFCWVYFLKLKSEVFEAIKVWTALIENQCGNKIKVLHTNNGKDYVNKALQQVGQ